MNESWEHRVANYLIELESAASEIAQLLDKCRVDTETVSTPEVQANMQALTVQLARLEEMVAHREQLLNEDDAPPQGLSLTDKCKSRLGEHALLTERCRRVAHSVADVNHRAVSLFVCQYHLAEFGNQLIRLVVGDESTQTYTSDGKQQNQAGGGGLLDEAA